MREALARVLNGQNHYGQIWAVNALCNLIHDHPGNQTRFATEAMTQALENVHRDAPTNTWPNIYQIIRRLSPDPKRSFTTFSSRSDSLTTDDTDKYRLPPKKRPKRASEFK